MALKRVMSRRHFLRNTFATAGAAGFPYIIPGKALGLDGAVAPSNKITMASIGVGGQGTYDTRALMSLPDTQYLAVCDVDTSHRERAKAMLDDYYKQKGDVPNFKGIDMYNDFREVLARPDIDAVMIAPPDFWHAVITVAAAEAGKDIYVEKPLANSVPEGRAVVNAVRRHKRVLQTGSHERSRDNARYAAELVRNGRIGKLHTVRVNQPIDNHGPIPNQPEMPVPKGFDYEMWMGPTQPAPYTEKRTHFWFRYIYDYSGGEMTDRGAHILDLAQLGHGTDGTTPIEYEGVGWFPPDGLFNTAMSYKVHCKYEDGVDLFVESVSPRGVKFEGSDGWIFIHVHGGDLEANPKSLLSEVLGPNELHLGRSRGHHADFIENVKSRGECKAAPEIGHSSASICHINNIAMFLGRKLKWDPVKEQFLNDDEANRMLVRSMRAPWHV